LLLECFLQGEKRREILNLVLNEIQTQAQTRETIIRDVQRSLVEARADVLKTLPIQDLKPSWITNLCATRPSVKS
jgi:hypothetical protein